jgi:opacity protein-like surface antigen
MRHGVAFFVALLLFSAPAVAQEEFKLHFLANGSLSFPQKPDLFKTAWKPGFNVGGGVGYRFSRHFSVQTLVNYDRFPFDEAGVMDFFEEEFGFDPRHLGISIEVQGANVSVVTVSGELKVSIFGDPDRVSPYVIAGAGVARLSTDEATVSLKRIEPISPACAEE